MANWSCCLPGCIMSTMSHTSPRTIVILHNIRSTYNVGAIFRTADAAGVSEVILAGYTPTPVDRFGRPRADIKKASLGAEESVPWKHVESLDECIKELQENGVAVVTVEQSSRAIDYKKYVLTGPTALIFGNEVEGVPKEAVEAADACIHIPMHGMKESLNVSVAAGVVLFRLLDCV